MGERLTVGVWCPHCGPDSLIDEDGCCDCGCDATGPGADEAIRIRAERDELKAESERRRIQIVQLTMDPSNAQQDLEEQDSTLYATEAERDELAKRLEAAVEALRVLRSRTIEALADRAVAIDAAIAAATEGPDHD